MDGPIVCDILLQVAGLEQEWQSLDDAANGTSPDEVRLAAARQEIRTELDRLLHLLPPEVGRVLQRLRSRGGRSVARVSGAACGACGNHLPTQLKASAERGRRLVRCPGCTRYLVRSA